MNKNLPLFSALCALLFTLILCSCANSEVGQSLQLSSAVLVKVPLAPVKNPIMSGSGNGWNFEHVLQAPTDPDQRGEWYVAWNNQEHLDLGSYFPRWNILFSHAPEIANAAHAAFGAYPVLIEPNRTFVRIASKAPPNIPAGPSIPIQYGSGARLTIAAMPMREWSQDKVPDPKHPGRFVIDPMWYQDARHSQLAAARARFDSPGQGIIIGHLDNGLDARHPTTPMFLATGDWRANTVGLLEYAQKLSLGQHPPLPLPPEKIGATHGLGTSGILAGGWVSLDGTNLTGGSIARYDGWLGGAPFATVVPVRVAPWVFSVSTGELAYGIDYASRVKGCDVITMSHGGSPTQAWADAVNAAYERGTAMFAAESDFFSVVPEPFRPRGIILPASPVYPAGFRRVIGVTGVTADDHSYARNTLGHLLSNPFGILNWASRGSYGADGTSTVVYRPNPRPDSSETRWLGQLRPYPIAAYSPNVPWLSIRTTGTQQIADGIDLNGAGTSASTPQVAAAAALWLQKHRAEFNTHEWQSWQKPEAVYYALLKSADRQGRPGPDPYLGAGLLRADDALKLNFAEIKKQHRPIDYPSADQVPTGSLWYEKSPRDYFDGARSFLGLLGLQTIQQVEPADRAKLRQQPASSDTYTTSLQRLYYNMLLLKQWHGGNIPRKQEEPAYWLRAGIKAKQDRGQSTFLDKRNPA